VKEGKNCKMGRWRNEEAKNPSDQKSQLRKQISKH
jgi:hypothetical protein